ncbi:transmembrane protein 107-like [Brevipalpus obovatus]|uniref:transmembrane protein 107-like n=1 Tax=Brevipalpus obovatus TaxID=246614 RepID=UPI003D9EF360
MKNLLSIRFLILITHLMLLVNHIHDKAGDTRLCFVKSQLTSDFEPSPTQLIKSLYTSIVLVIFEVIVCMIGVSIFYPFVGLFSIFAHGSATLVLLYGNEWSCSFAWWLMSESCLLPVLGELVLFVRLIISRMY